MYLVFYLVNNLFTIYLYVYTLHHIKTKKINHNTFLYISPIFFFHYRKQIHNFCRIHRLGLFVCVCASFFVQTKTPRTSKAKHQVGAESACGRSRYQFCLGKADPLLTTVSILIICMYILSNNPENPRRTQIQVRLFLNPLHSHTRKTKCVPPLKLNIKKQPQQILKKKNNHIKSYKINKNKN